MSTRGLLAVLALLPTLAPVACGGAKGAGAKSPGGAASAEDESIADIAAAQGGLPSLGGAGNREDEGALGATGNEIAMSGPILAEPLGKRDKVKLDGVLKEWPRRKSVSESLEGDTDGAGLAVAVQYDAKKLYVAAQIRDPKLARSADHREADDHASMAIAFPSGRGSLAAYEIGFWPGQPGESAGAVKWLTGPKKGKAVAGARLVEDDVKGGTTFEASVPWSSFPEARTMRVGLRAAFRYHDGDGKTTRGVLASGRGGAAAPEQLPALPTAAEQAVVTGLLGPKKLAKQKPDIDVFADVAGDAREERISVFGRFFTVCGPGYRGGKQFFWRDTGGELTSVEARKLTGHGKQDLVVRRRVAQPKATHETLEVWSFYGGDEPVSIFEHEVAIRSADGKKRVTNAVHVSAKQIEVSTEPAVGWDAASFDQPSLGEGEGILLPWGTVKSQTFKLASGRYTKASEVAQEGVPARREAASAREPQPRLPRDLPTPKVRKATDMGARVLAAYYRDQGVARGTKPRFDIEVNVDGDARPERVALIGRDIVVLGPGFKGGHGYARMSLTQFQTDKEIEEMTARDVTGDGAAELVIRGVRHVKTAKGERVEVSGIFIYRVSGGAVGRVLALETGRELGKKRVQGLVQFIPSQRGKGFDVDVRPGLAKGWTANTYPWPEDQPGGSIEPLLLPWGKTKHRRYAWDGSRFSP